MFSPLVTEQAAGAPLLLPGVPSLGCANVAPRCLALPRQYPHPQPEWSRHGAVQGRARPPTRGPARFCCPQPSHGFCSDQRVSQRKGRGWRNKAGAGAGFFLFLIVPELAGRPPHAHVSLSAVLAGLCPSDTLSLPFGRASPQPGPQHLGAAAQPALPPDAPQGLKSGPEAPRGHPPPPAPHGVCPGSLGRPGWWPGLWPLLWGSQAPTGTDQLGSRPHSPAPALRPLPPFPALPSPWPGQCTHGAAPAPLEAAFLHPRPPCFLPPPSPLRPWLASLRNGWLWAWRFLFLPAGVWGSGALGLGFVPSVSAGSALPVPAASAREKEKWVSRAETLLPRAECRVRHLKGPARAGCGRRHCARSLTRLRVRSGQTPRGS